MTRPDEQLLPPMKWNAWGDPAAAKPLSEGIRALLEGALGVDGSTSAELGEDEVRLRPSALSSADREALANVVGETHCVVDDRDRLLRAGGKSTLDLLRRKDSGLQDAPDAVLLPGDEDEVAQILRYCTHMGIAVVPFGGGTSVVGGLDPIRGNFTAVVSLDLRRLNELHGLDEISGEAELGAGLTGPQAEEKLRGVVGLGFERGDLAIPDDRRVDEGVSLRRDDGGDEAVVGHVLGHRLANPGVKGERGRP
jgi:alkyldihydroxyacetonephosphate synthase